jgi:hypothetical protein
MMAAGSLPTRNPTFDITPPITSLQRFTSPLKGSVSRELTGHRWYWKKGLSFKDVSAGNFQLCIQVLNFVIKYPEIHKNVHYSLKPVMSLLISRTGFSNYRSNKNVTHASIAALCMLLKFLARWKSKNLLISRFEFMKNQFSSNTWQTAINSHLKFIGRAQHQRAWGESAHPGTAQHGCARQGCACRGHAQNNTFLQRQNVYIWCPFL